MYVLNKIRNDTLLKEFGAYVQRLRQDKMLSQQALADSCEIEKSQVRRIENGQINPTLSTLDVLAKGLGVTVGELLKEF